MLIDKVFRHIFRNSLSGDSGVYIIYPSAFAYDIYEDLSLSKKTEDRIYDLKKRIDDMDEVIGSDAPVSSINGKTGDVKLFRSDINKFDDDPYGLTNVDNTSDAEKPPSDPFKMVWDEAFSNIKSQFDNMQSMINAYKKHVSADGGLPSKLNPHRTSLLSGIYYDGKVVVVDPNKFIRNQIVTDELNIHNVSDFAHPNIQSITNLNSGSMIADITQLNDRYDAIQKHLLELTLQFINKIISEHNSDTSSHTVIGETIDRESDRLQTIHDPIQNDRFEYVARRVDDIDLNKEYNLEYPSVKGFDGIIFKIPKGVSFYDSAIIPNIIFDTNNRKIDVTTTSGSKHSIPVNGGQTKKMTVFVNRTETSLGDISNTDKPIFVILSQSDLFGYKNENDASWNEFKIKIDIRHDPLVVSNVEYTEDILTKEEYDKLFPNVSLTGLFFSNEGVFINHRRTISSGDTFKTWHPLARQSQVVFMDDMSRAVKPKIKEHIENITDIEHNNTVNMFENGVVIGSMSLNNFPIRDQDGTISKSMVSIDTGNDYYTKRVTFNATNPLEKQFNVTYRAINF